MKSAACALLASLAVACHAPVNTEQQQQAAQAEPVRYGSVQVALTDSPIDDANVTAVNVCIARVDFVFLDGQPHGTLLVDRTIDLLELRNGVSRTLGIARLPIGRIQMVRLVLCPDGASAVVDGVEVPVKVPSGEQTGIKLTFPGGFEIRENVTTTIILDFDAERSLHLAPGQGWMLTPVVQLVETAILLAATDPLPGAVVRSPMVVRGTVASQIPLVELSVNGEAAAVDGLDWQAEVSVPEGDGIIHALAIDIEGRTAEVTFGVTSDSRGPRITILSPLDEARAQTDVFVEVTLEDTSSAVDAGSVRVTVNGSDSTTAFAITESSVSGTLTLGPGVHVIRIEASDLGGNEASAAVAAIVNFVAPSPQLRSQLDAIDASQRLPLPSGESLDIVDWEVRPDGTVAFVQATDLSPGCSLAASRDDDAVRDFVGCFVNQKASFFSLGGELPDPASISATHVTALGELDFEIIRVEQHAGGLLIGDAHAVIILHRGRIVVFSGRLYTPSRLPFSTAPFEATDPEAVRAAASTAVGAEVDLLRRYYDIHRNIVVAELSIRASTEVVIFDETHLAVIDVQDRAQLAQVSKTTTIGVYGGRSDPHRGRARWRRGGFDRPTAHLRNHRSAYRLLLGIRRRWSAGDRAHWSVWLGGASPLRGLDRRRHDHLRRRRTHVRGTGGRLCLVLGFERPGPARNGRVLSA